MSLIRREGFVTALRKGIGWYASQQEHGPAAAAALAKPFADAVDVTIETISRHPDSGVIWKHRPGYRFVLVSKPFNRWLIFCRHPSPTSVELVDLTRGEHDLPQRVG